MSVLYTPAEEILYTPSGEVGGSGSGLLNDRIIDTSIDTRGEFSKGVSRGIDQTQGLLAGAVGLAGDVLGLDTLRDWGFDEYQVQMAEANESPANVGSMFDIDSVLSFIDWAAGKAGELVPSVVGAIVSGGVGSFAGKQLASSSLKKALGDRLKTEVGTRIAAGAAPKAALAATLKEFEKTAVGKAIKTEFLKRGSQVGVVGFSGAVESGGNWVDDFATNGDNTNPIGDAMFGIASGLSELIGGEGRLISSIFGKKVGADLAKRVGSEAADKIDKGFRKLVTTEIAKSMVAEGSQEALQESLSILNGYLVSNSVNELVSEETFKQVAEAAAAGAVGGVMFGAPSGLRSYVSTKAQAEEYRKATEKENEYTLQQEREQKLIPHKAKVNTLKSSIDTFENTLNELKHQSFAEAFFANDIVAVSNNVAQIAKMESELVELKKAYTSAATSLEAATIEADADIEASIQNRERQASEIFEKRKTLNSAYNSVDNVVSSEYETIKKLIRKLQDVGASKEDINKFHSALNEMYQVSSNLVLSLEEKVPTSELFRVPILVTSAIDKIKSISGKQKELYKKLIFKLTGTSPKQQKLIEGISAEKRAFDEENKRIGQQMLADSVKERAELAKRTEEARRAKEEFLRASRSTRAYNTSDLNIPFDFPFMTDVRDQSKYLDTFADEDSARTYEDQAARTLIPEVQENLGIRNATSSWDALYKERGQVPHKYESGQLDKSGAAKTIDDQVTSDILSQRKQLVFKLLNAFRTSLDKTPISWAAVSNMTNKRLLGHINRARAGFYGKSAKDAASVPFGAALDSVNNFPQDVELLATIADITKVPTTSKTINPRMLVDKLVNALSTKGPFSVNEAKSILSVLLPNALNLSIENGAKWIADQLTIDKDTSTKARGSYIKKNGKVIISLLKANKSTIFHETAHVYLDSLVDRINNGYATDQEIKDLAEIQAWLGWTKNQKSFTQSQHEKFARGFEKYLMTEEAPSSKLKKFFAMVKEWFMDVYETAEALRVDVSPAMVAVYNHMLLGEKSRTTSKMFPSKPAIVKSIKRNQSIAETTKELASNTKTIVKRVTDLRNTSLLTEDNELDYRKIDEWKERLQDSHHPLQFLVKGIREKGGHVDIDSNVYGVCEAIPNEMSEELNRLNRRFIKNILVGLESYGKSLGVNYASALKNVDRYLHARHASERNAFLKSKGSTLDSPSGMSNEVAAKILDGAEFPITKQLKLIVELHDGLAKNQIAVMRQHKLLPASQIDAIERAYKSYTPLKGWEDMIEDSFPGSKKMRNTSSKRLFRATGRSSDSAPNSPLTNMILQAIDIRKLSVKVKADRALLKLIEDNKNTKDIDNFFFTVEKDAAPKTKWVFGNDNILHRVQDKKFKTDDSVLTLIDDTGKQVRVKAHDVRIARAFSGQNMAATIPVIDFIGNLTRVFARLVTTYNPMFIYTNPVRDTITAQINLIHEKHQSDAFPISGEKVGRTALKYYKGAAKAINSYLSESTIDPEWKQVLLDFRSNGGFSESFGLNTPKDIASAIEKSIKSGYKDGHSIMGIAANKIGLISDMLERQSNVLENMTRLSVFRSLSEAWVRSGMDPREAKIRAASSARNITVNFSKRGTWSPILGALFMFSGASIQGTTRMMKTIFKNRKKSALLLGTMMVGFATMAELARLMGGDDEDGIPYFDKLPQWIKYNSIIFMIPGTKGMYIRIPMAYGFNIFSGAGVAITDIAHGMSSPFEAAVAVTNLAFDNFSPIGSPETGWTTLIPTVFRPLAQIESNTGFFGQKIMPDVPSWIKYDYPDSQRYWSTVSPASKALARVLNSLTGGSTARPGLVSISPETIDHLIESYTGGLGKIMMGGAKLLTHAVEAKGDFDYSKLLQDTPLLNRFIGQVNKYNDLHMYNKITAQWQSTLLEKEIATSKGAEALRAFRKENPHFETTKRYMNTYEKKLRKLNKLRNSILKSSAFGSSNENARLEKIEKQIINTQKMAIKSFKGD